MAIVLISLGDKTKNVALNHQLLQLNEMTLPDLGLTIT